MMFGQGIPQRTLRLLVRHPLFPWVSLAAQGLRDIVTDADLAAQETLVSIIRSRFPRHGILSEEGLAPGNNTETIWVLDPLEGTSNYPHCLPSLSVAIGVAQGDELLVGGYARCGITSFAPSAARARR